MNDWKNRGACRNEDPDLFYPPSANNAKQIKAAKAICRRCPVKDACEADALTRDEQYGIWGGTTHADRNALLMKEKKACTGCGVVKVLAEFYSRPGRGRGHKSRCKACENEYVAALRARRREATEAVSA